MSNLKKSICIIFGFLLIVTGLAAIGFFALVTNVSITDKLIGLIGGLVVVYIGWWLLRRGSKSTRDAIGWFFVNILPW